MVSIFLAKERKFKTLSFGFTLLEAILYLAIAGIVLYLISAFTFNIIFGKSKIEAIHDINQNSQAVLDDISKTIGNSTQINGIVQ